MDDFGQIGDLYELLETLEGPELDFVLARSQSTTDKAGFTAAGVSHSAYYLWPRERRRFLNEVADVLRRDRIVQAQIALREAVAGAAKELVALTKSKQRDKAVRLRAIDSLLDRVLGKPSQRQELVGLDGGPISTRSELYFDFSSCSDEELISFCAIAGKLIERSKEGDGEASSN